MSELHNIGLITVLLADPKKNTLLLANDGLKQSTSNPLFADIPTDDMAMHALANGLITIQNRFTARPQLATKSEVNTKKNQFVTAYNKNAAFIQGVARDAAIDAGDVNVGITTVTNTGYYLKEAPSPTIRGFSGNPEGSGIVKITSKAVAQRAGYVRQFGETTAENVPPENTEELLFSLEVTILISGLKSKCWYAVREASIVPISRKAENSEPETKVEENITPQTIGKAHAPVFNHGDETNYQWGPWIYVFTK